MLSGTALALLEGCYGDYLDDKSIEGGGGGLLELLLLEATEAGG